MPPRKRSTLRDKVAAIPDSSRPCTPEPTTASGVARGRALYDEPLPGSQPEDVDQTQCHRHSTSRGITWAEEVKKSAIRSNRNRRTRARKAGKAQSSVPSAFTDAESTDVESQGTSNPLANRSDDEGDETDKVPESDAAPETQESTMPESTSGAGSSGGGHHYIDRAKFIAVASAALSEDLSNESTQALQHLCDFRNAYETPPLAASSGNSSIVVLSGEPLNAGGGWHINHPANNAPAPATADPNTSSSRTSKRRSTVPDPRTSKRQCLEISVDDSGTETIDESDFELEPLPPPISQSTPLPSAHPHSAPLPARESLRDRLARTDTQTTQLESRADPQSPAPQYVSTGSLSLGGSYHSSLANTDPPNLPIVAESQSSIRTYAGARSHAESSSQDQRRDSRSTATQLLASVATTSPAQPISGSQATSHSQTRPRAQHTFTTEPTPRVQPTPAIQSSLRPRSMTRWMPHTPTPIPEPPRRPRPAPSSSSATHNRPTDSSQQPSNRHPRQSLPGRALPRASASTQRSVRGVQDRRPWTRDPTAQARADMLAFNRAQAQDEARQIAESAARHTRHIERERERRSPSPSYRMLEDDEEIRACAKAAVSGIPKVSRCKKKPAASDSTGLSGQVLTLGKLTLFGLACSLGPYQTRGRFIHWARLVHEETWNNEAPDVPYIAATQSELEVMVNNLASLRGRVKDYLRSVIVTGYGFRRFAVSQEDILFNRERCASLCPNNFHCTGTNPRVGHYENKEIFHALAAGLFNGPNSIGALFEEYFEGMPLEVIAFIVAMMQFCIEEWANGWFEPKDLSAGSMLEKYEAHLFGLKEVFAVARPRVLELQKDLFEFAKDYARASTSRQNSGQERIHRSEIRPCTPLPAEHEAEEDVPTEHEDEEDVPTEYNEEGRLTSRSKGKYRAN